MSNDLILTARATISDIMASTMGISRGKWVVVGQCDTYAINVKREDGLVERVVGGDEDTAESLRNRGYHIDMPTSTVRPKPGVIRYNDASFIAQAPGLLDRSKATIDALMVEVSRLTKLNEELTANVNTYAAEVDDAEDRVADLERQLEDLRDENADLQNEIDALEDEADCYDDDDDDDDDCDDEDETYTHTFTSTETVIETVYYVAVERPEDMFLKVQNALLRIENDRLRTIVDADSIVLDMAQDAIDDLESRLAEAETQNENNAHKVQYYDDMEQHFADANEYYQKYLTPEARGRNCFLAIFDEARRIKTGA